MIRTLHRRHEFRTTDPERAHATLQQMYGSDVRMAAPAEGPAGMALTYVDTGEFMVAEMDFHSRLDFTMLGRDDVVIDTILGGTIEMDFGRRSARYRAGDVFVASQPDVEWPGHADRVRLHAVTLTGGLLREVAEESEGRRVPLPFVEHDPVPGGGPRWRQAVQLVDGLLEEPAVASPLVVSSAGRLLAATALSLFPSVDRSTPTRADRRDAHPPALRRAIAHMESHPHLPLTVVDVARAAYVSPRAIQIAFRRHLGTTPMHHLRRIRLDRAHADLLRAAPDEGATVTAIAARWGFASASRFAAQYREVYGRSPLQTLRAGSSRSPR